LHAARIQERRVLLVSAEDMLLQSTPQKKQKLNRYPCLRVPMSVEKNRHLLAKHLMLNPVSRQSGKAVPLHQRFFGGEMQPGVGHQPIENPVDHSVAFRYAYARSSSFTVSNNP
jgi:hypothetical protein